jgi:predicted alpha/beta hydrolase family esterase
MKTQVFVIHGGHARDSYEDYLKHLIEKQVDLEYLRNKSKGWKRGLAEELGEGYEVFNPQMPNVENAKYIEWKIWFEKFIPYFSDGIIFVGHSLGGIFLSKYLSENELPIRIGATFLVAAPYNTATNHPRADFNIIGPLTKFSQQSPEIFIYQSKDDEIVPFSNFEHYQQELPKAHIRVFETNGHFSQEKFPEIVADILELAK